MSDRFWEFLETVLKKDKDVFLAIIFLAIPLGLLGFGIITPDHFFSLEKPVIIFFIISFILILFFFIFVRINKILKVVGEGSSSSRASSPEYTQIVELMTEISKYLNDRHDENLKLVTQMIQVQQALKKMPSKKQIIMMVEYGLMTLTFNLIETLIAFSRQNVNLIQNQNTQRNLIRKAELDISDAKNEFLKIINVHLNRLVSPEIYSQMEYELDQYLTDTVRIILRDQANLEDKIININLLARTLSNNILGLIANNLKWPDED